MNISQYVLILGALFLLAALLLGTGIAMYSGQRKKEAERIADEKQALLAGPAPEAPAGEKKAVPAPPEQPAPKEQVEILRVVRDSLDGSLAVQVLGKQARSADEMDEARRRQLKNALDELTLWLEKKGGAPVEPPATETEPEAEAAGSGYFADTLPDRVELKDVIPFRKKNIPKLAEAPPAPKSIVAQIDDVLQGLLAASPQVSKTIRLSEDPAGGLVILAGERQYRGIEEVDDDEVRTLIKRAVREWN